jgi:hypothetical protein
MIAKGLLGSPEVDVQVLLEFKLILELSQNFNI